MSDVWSGEGDDHVVRPMVRRVDHSRPVNLEFLPEPTRGRVATVLQRSRSSRLVKPRRRRVMLGYGGFPFDAGNDWLAQTVHGPDSSEKVYTSAVRMWVDYWQVLSDALDDHGGGRWRHWG